MITLVDRAADLLLGGRCLGCGTPGRLLCPGCQGRLAAGGPVPGALLEDGPVAGSVVRHGKFGRARAAASVLAGLPLEWPECDAITWIPPVRQRARSRGWSLPELVAVARARATGVPAAAWLARTRDTVPQRGLPRAERHANVEGAFACLPEPALQGKRLLVLDDVWTTGATLHAAARAVEVAGIRAIPFALVRRF